MPLIFICDSIYGYNRSARNGLSENLDMRPAEKYDKDTFITKEL